MDNLTAGNPKAHRVRVYYDGSSTIAEGMPVCYNYLTTQNWFGGSVSDEGVVTANETTPEGSHNESKYIHVCNPVCVNSTDGIATDSNQLITSNVGNEWDNLQVGMFVSITGTDITSGNYKITAIDTANDTITLDMTVGVAATTDVTVKIDNLHAFAGVVSKGGWCGKTGPRVLDIYVSNGAIVPVLTVLDATVVGRTILSINSGTLTFGNPETDMPRYGFTAGEIDSRAVAIAEETISAAGLLLAKLDDTLFVYQGGQIGHEMLAGYVGTVHTAVNTMNVEFAQTANDACLLHYRAKLSGTCQSKTGVYRFDTHINADMAGSVFGHEIYLEIGANQTAANTMFAASRILLRTRNTDPNLISLEYVCVQAYEWSMTAAGGPTGLTDKVDLRPWFRFSCDGDLPTHLFFIDNAEGMGGHVITTDPTPVAGDQVIAVNIGGATYYIVATIDDGI